jgi:hypothetical protein
VMRPSGAWGNCPSCCGRPALVTDRARQRRHRPLWTLEQASKNQEKSMEMECERVRSEHQACRASLIGLIAALAT